MDKREQNLFDIACEVAQSSQHRKRKVGAVLFDPRTYSILSVGWNRLSFGLDEQDERFYEAPLKNKMWEHAERDCLYMQDDIDTRDTGMAVNWFPCADCARAIVYYGITVLIAEEPDWEGDEKWALDWAAAREILEAGNCKIIWRTRPGSKAPQGNLIEFPTLVTTLPPLISPLEPQ